jgi:hypothetical protein
VNESKRIIVGHFETRSEIVVEREPEVGLTWIASARDFNQGAIGETPREAVVNLIDALSRRGIGGSGVADWSALDGLGAEGTAS